ncbi:family 1 glycosylhydrolase [Microvirga thermotolerans]|uniref:dTDP-4-dehydrorhamnose reductase n=1 Tax=Microvirga thermotolerans TaxID=2651334 RepID=A0A5P9K2B2_9HYPH|nr:family 1 glycosylhydrolase [Microvirga thermotolerans]QFU17850.1 sugar nucleotide-binding protein [Microvirga thermotolerans]
MKQALELWGGIECTVARIGDAYRDQSLETGHSERLEDLDRIANLGIGTLRYPVLWETVSPSSPHEADFAWHDARLKRLRELNIRAIAGLCHHGSGPRYTDMLDPAWPELLAGHAKRVAERYPHLDLYTPVNEPLTTARFSGLYGHWYPHGTGYETFLRILVNECKATVLSMRAIREVRPDAQLVQTDDMGKTFSTPLLAYQAEHENQRRWLTFDLLCGMVDREHPWWRIFLDHGIEERELAFFLEADPAPDIIGINHYLTSERYLDERLSRYPEHHWGGNGRHRYADAEAVRMPLPPEDLGPLARLRETWERYRRPVAVTEVHHGCTRDEQLRWLVEVWQAAQQLREEGADIRAVTVWSLFGTVDWNTLLTQRTGCYEPGIFDVRGREEPRRTALAHAAESLARRGIYDHPVLDRAGWWRRDSRFYRPPSRRSNACRLVDEPRRLLITGATGTLGQAFSRICHHRGLDHVLVSRRDMDIADPRSVEAALACHRPWAVVNTAGYVRVAQAEAEPEKCFRENAVGAEILAAACARGGVPFVTFSSDLVFGGDLDRPYRESDPVSPTSVYGASKAEAERRVLAAHGDALVVRTSAFFGPWDRYNFVWWVLNALARGETVEARADIVSPTYVPDLVHEVLNLLVDGETGLWHLANPGSVSWYDLARAAADRAGYDPERVVGIDDAGPSCTVLTSERGILLPPFESAFERFFRDSEIAWSDAALQSIAAE